MAFFNVRPLDTAQYGSEGGPEYKTDIRRFTSGYESRKAIWTAQRHTYRIVKLMLAEQVEAVLNLFLVCRGRIHGFRLKDWWDYRTGSNFSAPAFDDEVIGTGDGVTTVFQLVKNYAVGSTTYARTLTRIVSSTAVAGAGGVEKTEGADWSVDTNTGLITFTSAPASSTAVTAGCEFDVPVRFDTDELLIRHAFYHGTEVDIPLVELRV